MSRGSRRLKPFLFAAIVGLLGLTLPAFADPPARVGRLSGITGTVSFHDSGDEQWSPATLNYPVTSGNSFWTEPGARAEIQVGSTAIHLDSSTELDITALDDQRFDATLAQGTVNIRVPRFNNGDGYTITTPRGTVTLASPGTYRIFAGTDRDPTQVAVLEGAARVVDQNSTVTLSRGEEALLSGTDTIDYQITEAQPTPFDNDSLASERREEQASRPAARYVSPEMTGYEDLDDHGVWHTDPAYGAVWYPQAVPADWAPYRYGHWRWVDPWGWTWIDDQPWGFAPFHYGRWAYIGNRWGWTPGTVVVRPVYAPALVAFVGGTNWNLSLSFGGGPSVGWFPLAPREVYVPSYPASVTYVRNVNVTNVTNVTDITNQTINNVNVTNVSHVNQRFATVVPQDAFVRARPVARAAIAVPRAALDRAPVSTGAPITPAVAATSGHQEAVRRATRVAQAQGQRIEGPAPLAVPPAANAAPAAPGPAIAHGGRPANGRPEAAQAQRNQPQQAGQAAPAAQPRQANQAQPRQANQAQPPQANQAQPAAQPPRPGQPGRATTPQPNAPVWSKTGPAVAHPTGTSAAASARPQANGNPPSDQARPAVTAAPGPPIQHNAPAATPRLVQRGAPAPSEIKPPVPASPTVSSAVPPRAPTSPTAPVAPSAPNAAPREPVRHAATVQQPTPQVRTSQARPAQSGQVVQKSIPAPQPPERKVARPVQQTVLQPTHQGWVRAPTAPQAQQAAPHPAAAQQKKAPPAPVQKAAPAAVPPQQPPQQHSSSGHPNNQPEQKHVNG